MTDWNLSTGAEQPINRTGAPEVQVVGDDVQGTLVGVEDDGSGNYQLVAADAQAESNGGDEVAALGVLLPERIVDETALDETHPLYDQTEQLTMENRTLKGDRAVFVAYGVEIVNDDDDTSFEPGQPVYLDVGGGFTQTKPSTAGDIQQAVGVCLPPNDDAGIGTEQGDRLLLDVDLKNWTTA